MPIKAKGYYYYYNYYYLGMLTRVEKVDVIGIFIIITRTSQLYSPSPGTFLPTTKES